MAITNKEEGVWDIDQVYNKINQGSIWGYSTNEYELWAWGSNHYGQLGQNESDGVGDGGTFYSSPVQIPGTSWSRISNGERAAGALKNDNTLWTWGTNQYGQLGHNSKTRRSSPTQIPGTSWSKVSFGRFNCMAIRTDGTLWTWGRNNQGQLGHNNKTEYSSPKQIPGSWSDCTSGAYGQAGLKTDGTMWSWGYNGNGQLGENSRTNRSSPIQIPGSDYKFWPSQAQGMYTNWFSRGSDSDQAWGVGRGHKGQLGQNNDTSYSSPVQVPGSWANVAGGYYAHTIGVKTDGTLWSWGYNHEGQLGDNSRTDRNSPVQIGSGTDWSDIGGGTFAGYATKTDGTLWSWGYNTQGQLGQNNLTKYSSPVQIPGTSWHTVSGEFEQNGVCFALKQV